MRPRPYFLEGLLDLHLIPDKGVRRGVFRQSIASLGLTASSDGPAPLEGLNPETLLKSLRVGITDGLLDDLDWLAPSTAAVALYEIAAALPLGAERRDLGRRVLAHLYEGNAATFVAIATRMAAGSARGLGGAGVRARVALSLSLPAVADVPVDPLALALASRRDLAKDWIGAASTGSLPDRRLAARLLERAAREAARRASHGDDDALRLFRGVAQRGPGAATKLEPALQKAARFGGPDPIATAWRNLLADRETLVWRHVAAARGLLTTQLPEIAEEIEALLAPSLSPTEWRRGATSLVASIAVDPDRALRRALELLHGPLLREDPGIATAMVWGLARASDAEPEPAEELLDAIVTLSPLTIAESLIELRRDVGAFGARAALACAAALESSLSEPPTDEGDGLAALNRTILRDLRDEASGAGEPWSGAAVGAGARGPLVSAVQAAVLAFVDVGPREAHARGLEALALAEGTVSALEALDPPGPPIDRGAKLPMTLGLLRDLDASLLESGVLKSLLLLDRGGHADEGAAAAPIDDLDARLITWLLHKNASPDGARSGAALQQCTLRALLHVIDGEPADFGDNQERRARARSRWMHACGVLLDRLLEDRSPPLRRVITATLARAFDALVRDGAADAADVLLQAAMRIEARTDLEILAEASMHPDVSQLIRLYAAFAARADEDPGARVEALQGLLAEVPAQSSQRTEVLRSVLTRLARALEAVLAATALVDLVSDSTAPEAWPLLGVEDAMTRLGQLTAGALRRCGDTQQPQQDSAPRSRAPDSLAPALDRVVSGAPNAGEGLMRAMNRSLAASRNTVPGAITSLVRAVLARITQLPATRAAVSSDAPSSAAFSPFSQRPTPLRPPLSTSMRASTEITDATLPAWIPSRRTLGGFYVHRQLGGGGVGTVFAVTRTEDRHDASAERFALKVPDYDATAARSLSEAEFLKLFREEARALLALPEHENIARFVTFDAGARPKPILVMELVEGIRCDLLIESRTLTTTAAVKLLDGVLAGLEAMHSVGIGHLDIKPSNVVLRGGKDAVLVDFGLAGRNLRPGCATGCYGAPEVWGITVEGSISTPLTADVYSFGCLAYEVFTGSSLFDAPTEVALISAHLIHDGLPPPIKRLAAEPRLEPLAMFLVQCLRHAPKDRAAVPALRHEFRRIAETLRGLPWPLEAGDAGEELDAAAIPLTRR